MMRISIHNFVINVYLASRTDICTLSFYYSCVLSNLIAYKYPCMQHICTSDINTNSIHSMVKKMSKCNIKIEGFQYKINKNVDKLVNFFVYNFHFKTVVLLDVGLPTIFLRHMIYWITDNYIYWHKPLLSCCWWSDSSIVNQPWLFCPHQIFTYEIQIKVNKKLLHVALYLY